MSDVIVAGHVCLDVIPAFYNQSKTMEELFVPGKLINMDRVKIIYSQGDISVIM